MYPNAFKASVMMLKTSKGSQIRDYYITLEKLIKAYVIYQALFKGREAEQAMLCKDNHILEIKNMLSEERIKTEEREKKAEEDRKKSDERFQRLLGVVVKKQCPNILGDDAILTKYGKYQLYGSHTITKPELLRVINRVKEIWNQDLEYPSEEVEEE